MAGKLLEQQFEYFSPDMQTFCMDEVLRAFDDLPLAETPQVAPNLKKPVLNGTTTIQLAKEKLKTKLGKVKRKRDPCSLCHVERDGVRRRLYPCGHVFHKSCFWSHLSIDCPLCKGVRPGVPIPNEDIEDQFEEIHQHN